MSEQPAPLFVNHPEPENPEEILSEIRAAWPFGGTISLVSSRQKSVQRVLLEVEHQSANGPVRMVVKRAQCDRVERGHRALEALWAAGFAPPGRLRVPRPVLLLRDACISVQERSYGLPLSAMVERGAVPDEAAEAIASYVERLQSAPVAAEPATTDLFASSIASFDLLASVSETAPAVARRITERVTEELSRTGSLVPAHGDLSPKHIFLTPGATTLIDWDKFSLAPPAMDLGYLIARLALANWTQDEGFGRTRGLRTRILAASGRGGDRNSVAVFAALALVSAAGALSRFTGGSEIARMRAYVEAAARVFDEHGLESL